MKTFLSLLLGVFLLTACEADEDKAPVAKDKMQLILTDINYAEVYSTMVNDSLQQVMNKNRDSLAMFYKDILTHHGLTMDELIESFTWYQKHPQELEKVYQDMIPDITTQQDLHNTNQ